MQKDVKNLLKAGAMAVSYTHLDVYKRQGVIGGTGSAKTTLVSLIPRLYDVTGGEVLVDVYKRQEVPL